MLLPYDIKDWKVQGCSLTLQVVKLSVREIASSEIYKKEGEGSALNADYPTMEAGLIVANILGSHGLTYGQDFFFKTARFGQIIFDFCDKATYEKAKVLFRLYEPEEKTVIAEKSPVKCLLCGGDMRLELDEKTHYWQCEKDQNHRMTLPEWSDLREEGGAKAKVVEVMKERQATLQAQSLQTEETLKFVADEERKKKIKELMDKGYQWRCLKCNTVFKEKRVELFEDGHGGRSLEMCRCGCDLFQKLSETTCLNIEVKPVNGTLVFKEHHAKYCQCDKGKIWTGDSETECRPSFKVLGSEEYPKKYRCSQSGLIIVILKSTKEELTKPDELGSAFLRIPG